MAIAFDDDLAADALNAIIAAFPAGSVIGFYSGSKPSSPNDAASGTLIAEITLPATPWAAVSGKSVSKSGTWEDASADNAGTMGWFRLKNAADTKRLDGTVTATSSGGDCEVDNPTLTAGQKFTITGLTLSAP